MDTIMAQLGDGALGQMSKKLGTDEKTTAGAAGASVAALLGALSRNASRGSGAAALDRAPAKDHDGSILDNLPAFLEQAEQGLGDDILKHVLGRRRGAVEAGNGRSTGMDADKTGSMLKMLAPVVLGALGKAKRTRNLDERQLQSWLGDERRELETRQPKAMGSLASMLDSDGDGDVDMSDIAKHGMGFLGKSLKG